MRRGPRARIGAAAGAVVVGCVCLGGGAGTGTAAAQGQPSFRATASAEGVRTGVTANGAPLTNQVVDGASPIAQAAVDSTSGSTALASVAYPGDLIITAPGLVAGFSHGQVSGLPGYPLIAVAGSTTSPDAKIDNAGSSMHASAGDRRAEGSASSGAGGSASGNGETSANAKVVADDRDVVTASSTSNANGVAIGPLVLGHVAASGSASRAPGAAVTRKASFSATGITVAGVPVSLTSDGLVLAGTHTPVSTSALGPVLQAAGISLQTLSAQDTDDGVVSAGLVVTKTQGLPAAINGGAVTYTFGRAVAAVAPVSLPELVSGSVTEPPLPVSGTAFDTGSAAAVAPTLGQTAVPSAPVVAATPRLRSATRPASQVGRRPTGFFDVRTFYGVLLVAAACAAIVLEILRYAGVRLLWT